MNDYLSPDGLYRQGIHHFNRGEWHDAINVFTQLQAAGYAHSGVAELLADARLKQQIESAPTPLFRAPPRSPKLLRVLLAAIVVLVFIAGIEVYLLLPPAPAPAMAASKALPKLAEPTPTTAPQPAAVSTASAQEAVQAEPAAEQVQTVAGSVEIKTAEGETFVNTPNNIEIIVDASGSMLAEVEGLGKQRWQVAQEALMGLITSGTISQESYVALRTYGRNRGSDCGDLELAQKLKRFKGDALAGVVMGIKPAVQGMTPLGASLREATQDLLSAEGTTVVILLTDGVESCNGDPVGEAASFVKDNPQRKVHVIGFALGDQQASDKLREVAVAGNGLYFDATNAAELTAAMRQTIELGYQIVAEDGREVATGIVGKGEALKLDPGTYQLNINANPPVVKELIVESGAGLEVQVRQGYGGLVADVKDVSPVPEGQNDF
jgi:Ca-activated chloride channel homolog